MRNILKRLMPSLFVVGILSLSACIGNQPVEETPVEPAPIEESDQTGQAGLPNPASVYCEEQGGTVEIHTAVDGSQYGECVFADGSMCDEWTFFRGECSPGEDTSPEAAPENKQPLAAQRYTNEVYGFSLNPPDSWEIEAHEDFLRLEHPGYSLFIGFQWASEDPKPFRTGMPQGEIVDGGTASLLGQAIPKRSLVWDGKTTVVMYGTRTKVGKLVLVIYLDAVETPETSYADLDIPPEIMAEADQIIATFELTSGETPVLDISP